MEIEQKKLQKLWYIALIEIEKFEEKQKYFFPEEYKSFEVFNIYKHTVTLFISNLTIRNI